MSRRQDSSDEYDVDDNDTFELASLLQNDDEVNTIPRDKPPEPLPKLQVFVLLLLYFAAPICTTLRAPFIVELIRGLKIPPKEVGYYTGVLDSLTSAGEAISVLQWGRLSDRIGRRPVLLVCTFGIAGTLMTFGLSKTYTGLALSRAAEGLLNGNLGTIKAMLAELTAGDDHKMAEVFSLMPMVWAIGASIGPVMGGSLANPSERFPNAFNRPLWKEHPYLLACLAGAAVTIIGFLGILFYLKETLSTTTLETTKYDRLPSDIEPEGSLFPSPPLWSALFRQRSTFITRRLLVTLVNYAFLSFLDASLYATYTLLLASPIASGGLNFTPKTIGYILGAAALGHGLIQGFCFARILKRWGVRNVYATSIIAYMFMYIMMPIMNALTRRAGRATPLVWGLIIIEEFAFFASYSSYSCMYIFVSQASPSRSALGRTHGLGQTVSAVMAAIGPATATSLVALSLQHNLLGGALGHFLLAGTGAVALGLTSLLPPSRKRMNGEPD